MNILQLFFRRVLRKIDDWLFNLSTIEIVEITLSYLLLELLLWWFL